MMTSLFLGVDAGATRTRVAVCNEKGELVGTGVGGAGHCLYVGVEGMARSLREALTNARFQGYHFRACCFASASLWVIAGYSPYYDQIKKAVESELDTDQLLIENDACAALWGAFSGRPGIVCIAGTGAVVLARTRDGEIVRAGGWGHILGDEGSAYRISLDAIQAALRAHDGVGEQTSLLERVLSFFQWQDLQEAINFFYGQRVWQKHEVARFAPLVVAEAVRGDHVAIGIVKNNISFLGRCVQVLSKKTQINEVAPIGGVFESEFVKKCFTEKLVGTGINCVEAELPPVLGAVGLAMEATGALTQGVVIRIKENAKKIK